MTASQATLPHSFERAYFYLHKFTYILHLFGEGLY